MASTRLDWTQITPDNGAVKQLSALIFQSILDSDKLGSIFNIIPNQKNGDKLGFVGQFGLIGRASTGCSPDYESNAITASEKTWSIKAWEVAEKLCWKDIEGTIAALSLKNHTAIADMTSTEYLADIIMPRLEVAIRNMLMRLAWFGDTAAETTANGGILLAGTDKTKFTIVDGFWKRLYAIVAADASRRTTIAANAQQTKAAQKSAFKASGVATGTLDALIEDASLELREADNKVIYIPLCFADALDADIRANNKGSELQWESIFSGVKTAKYNGIDVVVLPEWDNIIKTYEGTSTKWNDPYRAIFTTRENLAVGLESQDELNDMRVFFDETTLLNHIYATDKLGTLVMQDNLVQVAY